MASGADGASFVYSIEAIKQALAVTDPLLLTKYGIDDIVGNQHKDLFGNILHNVAIDTQAAYALVSSSTFNSVFNVYDASHAPLGIGGLPHSLAVQGSATPLTETRPIVLAQHQKLNGFVGQATLDDGDSPASLTPKISWGDGSTSTAPYIPVSPGVYLVTGQHTWHVDGTYMIVVSIGLNPGIIFDHEPIIIGVPVVVLPLTDADELQAVDPATRTITISAADLAQNLSLNAGSFTLSLTGSVAFNLSYDLNEAHKKSHYNSKGSFSFTGSNAMVAKGTYVKAADPAVTLKQETISLEL